MKLGVGQIAVLADKYLYTRLNLPSKMSENVSFKFECSYKMVKTLFFPILSFASGWRHLTVEFYFAVLTLLSLLASQFSQGTKVKCIYFKMNSALRVCRYVTKCSVYTTDELSWYLPCFRPRIVLICFSFVSLTGMLFTANEDPKMNTFYIPVSAKGILHSSLVILRPARSRHIHTPFARRPHI